MKSNLGIILEGNRDYILKEKRWMKILSFICSWGMLIYFLLGLLFFILAIFTDIVGFSEGIVAIISALIMCPVIFIWDAEHRCPFCHHFFAMKKIGKDYLTDEKRQAVSRTVNDFTTDTVYDMHGNKAYINRHSHHKEHGVKTTRTFSFNKKCKYCGCVYKAEKENTTTEY